MAGIVIVGSGGFAKKHANVFKDLGFESVFVSRNQGRVDELNELGLTAFGGVEEAVLASNASHIVIASRPSQHLSDALESIAFGIPVLIEKPVCTVSDLTRIKSLVKHADLISVGCVLRFDQGLLKFRELLPQIGTVHYANTSCQSFLPDWRTDQDLKSGYASTGVDGGVLSDLVHELDYMSWVFGEVSRVMCQIPRHRILGLPNEEQADLLCETTNRTSFHVRLDYVTRKPRRLLTAFGEKGELSWDAIEGVVELTLIGRDGLRMSFEHTPLDNLRAQDNAFVTGDTGLLASLADGIEAMTLVDKAIRFNNQNLNNES